MFNHHSRKHAMDAELKMKDCKETPPNQWLTNKKRKETADSREERRKERKADSKSEGKENRKKQWLCFLLQKERRTQRKLLVKFLKDHCKTQNEMVGNDEKSAFDFVYLPIDYMHSIVYRNSQVYTIVRELHLLLHNYKQKLHVAQYLPFLCGRDEKGKGVLVEEPKPLKKQAQIEQDKAYARELEAELNKNSDWDEVNDHVHRKQKEDNAVKRYQALKMKPQTKAKARKNMMIYLRNVAGFKMDYFKGMTYDDIRLILKKNFESNVAFLQNTKEHMDEEDSRALKRLKESQEDKAAKNRSWMRSLEMLKVLKNSLEVLKVLKNSLEMLKVLQMELQENSSIDEFGSLSIKKSTSKMFRRLLNNLHSIVYRNSQVYTIVGELHLLLHNYTQKLHVAPYSPFLCGCDEDWVSNLEDESETKTPQNVPSFVQPTEQVKSPRLFVQHVETSIPSATSKAVILKPSSNGKRRNRKACFVCKSLDHLIKDRDYHTRHVVPTVVVPKSKLIPINAARPITAVVPKINVPRPRKAKPNVTKPTSPPKRHINRSPSLQASNFPPKVTVVKAPMVNAAKVV
nr:hypothetical protein [Tanacetum cinerariifolium]